VPRAFWITPFTPEAAGNEDPDRYKAVQQAIREAARDLVDLDRADDIFEAGVVIEQIRGAIESADLVIAICTGRNPNVFYELGLAEIVRHSPILVAATAEDLPFDVRHWRAQTYAGDPPLSSLAKRIRQAIEHTLAARRSDPGLVVPDTKLRPVTSEPVVTAEAGGTYRVHLPNETAPLRACRDGDFIAFNEHVKDIISRLAQLHSTTAQANENVQPAKEVLTRMAEDRYGLVAEMLDWFEPAAEYRRNWIPRALRHVIPWFGRRATSSDSGYTFWIGFHKSWVVLVLKSILGAALAVDSWDTVGELVAISGVDGQSEAVPLLVDPSFTWADGYGGNAEIGFKDLLAFHEWLEKRGPHVEPDPISRTCGVDVVLGIVRCLVDTRAASGDALQPADGPTAYAGFAAYHCERVRWVTRRLARDGAATQTLGVPDPAELNEIMSRWWPALVRRAPQNLFRSSCTSWTDATAAR
jgi:hypothetical protein